MVDAIERTEIQNIKQKIYRKIVGGIAISLSVLSLLTIFSKVHTTVSYGWPWAIGYLIILFAFLFLLKITPANLENGDIAQDGSRKKTPQLWAGILGVAAVTGYSLFSGVPTLMHFFTRTEGIMQVTVVAKESNYLRGMCRPRLIIKEFTFFQSDHICPSQDTYDRIEVGTVLKLKGKVSQYGVEPKQFSWPNKTE